jgi:signal transduction histidine kinase
MLALQQPPPGYPRRRFTIAVIPGLVTLLVVGVALCINQRLIESRRGVDHSHTVIDISQRLLVGMLNAETGVRAYVLVGDPQFLDPYIGSDSVVHDKLQQLRQLTAANPLQQRRLTEITALVDKRFTTFRQMIAQRRSGNDAAAVALMPEGKLGMDQLRRLIAAFRGEERYLLLVRDQQDRWNQWIAAFVIGVGGLIVVLVSLVTNRLLLRHATELADANVELSTQAQRLEEQALELESQASELEATATELEATNAELEEQAIELEEQRDMAQSSRAEAEQANAAKSRFLSVMSHELRTPLNAIAGYVDLISASVHGPVTEEQHEDIRRIKRAVAQLTSVINDILNFAKLEAGEVRFEVGAVQMREALANAIALMEPQAAAKGIRFLSTSCDPGVVAQADRERVQQVVLNLLSNAVKYTQERGEVRIACAQDGRTIRVRVSDTGRGIAADDLHRIFDPFVQLPGAARIPSEGVGLGLAISRDLARGMGGDITVDSRIGEGSIFEFTLPSRGGGGDRWTEATTAPDTLARAARSDPASRMESRGD